MGDGKTKERWLHPDKYENTKKQAEQLFDRNDPDNAELFEEVDKNRLTAKSATAVLADIRENDGKLEGFTAEEVQQIKDNCEKALNRKVKLSPTHKKSEDNNSIGILTGINKDAIKDLEGDDLIDYLSYDAKLDKAGINIDIYNAKKLDNGNIEIEYTKEYNEINREKTKNTTNKQSKPQKTDISNRHNNGRSSGHFFYSITDYLSSLDIEEGGENNGTALQDRRYNDIRGTRTGSSQNDKEIQTGKILPAANRNEVDRQSGRNETHSNKGRNYTANRQNSSTTGGNNNTNNRQRTFEQELISNTRKQGLEIIGYDGNKITDEEYAELWNSAFHGMSPDIISKIADYAQKLNLQIFYAPQANKVLPSNIRGIHSKSKGGIVLPVINHNPNSRTLLHEIIHSIVETARAGDYQIKRTILGRKFDVINGKTSYKTNLLNKAFSNIISYDSQKIYILPNGETKKRHLMRYIKFIKKILFKKL